MKTLERQLSDYGRFQKEIHGQITVDEILSPNVGRQPGRSRTPVRPVLIGGLVVLAVLLVGVLSLSRSDDSAPANTPPPPTQPISPDIDFVTEVGEGRIEWTFVEGKPDRLYPGASPFSFRRIAGSDAGFAIPDWRSSGGIWLSEDGIDWEFIPARDLGVGLASNFTGAQDGFLMTDAAHDCDGRGTACRALRSRDGRSWETVDTQWTSYFDVDTNIWFLDSVDEIVAATPPGIGPWGGFANVVVQYDGQVVYYVGNDVAPYTAEEGFLTLVLSDDATDVPTFDRLPAPDFADELGRNVVCGIAESNGTVLAMYPVDETTYQISATDNGSTWRPVSTVPQGTTQGGFRTSMVGEGFTRDRCLTALEDAWLIRSVDPTQALISTDGVVWHSVGLPPEYSNYDSWINVAGNTMFVTSSEEGHPNVLVGRFRP